MEKMTKTEIPSLTLNTDSEAFAADERTYIIFGLPRGGTTMAAGVARLCGLNIGDDLPDNAEDPAFNPIAQARKGIATANMRNAIAGRNAAYKCWGWKYPAAAKYLPKLRQSLRNPCLIVVFRDPVATQLRNFAKGNGVEQIINNALKAQKRNWNLVRKWSAPTLLVSYEKAVAEPENFIEHMCNFLKTERPSDIDPVIEFMRAGTYKPLSG